MKSFILTALLVLSPGVLLHAADVITLKDGTRLEGKISDEDADTITIKVPPADGGLAVPRIVRRSDIKELDREGPDIAAYEALKDLVPAPDRLTAEQYKERIGRGQAFMNRFADSKHAPAVKKMMEQLEAERKLAAQGALKLGGKWIPAATRRKDAYAIDAKVVFSDMEADYEQSRYQAALRHFETIESEFKASAQFAKARILAIEALNAY
nr:hypothetical protein [Akkermansiaceae bacterium]